jgi:ABC-2 type transport system ATP-binding protein
MNVVDIHDLRKSFAGRPVLAGLSFSVKPGEVYGLLGPNGSGKTTTINILCNLLAADTGSAAIAGIAAGEETKRLIGFAPQEISIYRDLTCAENLDFFARLHGLAPARRPERVAELIAAFHLGDYADTPVGNLSGGWQRRINIAVALVHAPRLLVLDEPTAALDVEARYELWQLIRELNATGMAILLTTHHLEEAELLCSRIGIVRDGRIAAEGTLAQLRASIPAEQLAVIEARDEKAVLARARESGWQVRRYSGRPTLWLPRVYTLAELVGVFAGIDVSSMTLTPVGLEHVYLEVTSAAPAAAAGRPEPAAGPRLNRSQRSGASPGSEVDYSPQSA